MEALSPPFSGFNPAKAAAAFAPVQTQKISLTVPLFYICTGITSLFAGALFLVVKPDILATYHYNQYVIAVTHLFVLGWLASITLGAMYQLVPIALETTLHNARLGRWSYACHVVGVTGMVWSFWIWSPQWFSLFGSLVTVGIGLFIYNIARTLRRVPRWDVVAGAVGSALFWLAATISAGLFAAAAKCWEFSSFQPIALMHAHAHLGALGFFLMMIVGVSYKLIPMFCLSEVQNVRRAWWSIILLNLGVAGLFFGVLLNSPWKLAFALVVLCALLLYGLEMRAIVRARVRRRLDGGVKFFLAGLLLLVPLGVSAVVLSWPGLPTTALTTQLENVYGWLGLAGVITFAIVGMLYKIVPFLVWFTSYSKEIGRSKVPSLSELYSERLQTLGSVLLGFGLLATGFTTALGHELAVRCSCAVFLAGVVVFGVNMLKILSHLWHPQIEPLNFKTKLPSTNESHAKA